MTLQEISDMVLRGQQLQSALVGDAITAEAGGTGYKKWSDIFSISTLIDCLKTKIAIQDYISAQTIKLYQNLDCFVGGKFLVGVNLDPLAQQTPGVIFVNNTIIVNEGAYQIFPFTNLSPVDLFANYHTLIFPLFGNGAVIQIYTLQADGSYMPDFGTTPDIVFQDNDPTKDILSMIWDYPVPTSGYIKINGASPSGASSGGITNLPIFSNSTDPLTDMQLNAIAPFAAFRQLIILPNVPSQYEKMDNSPTGTWELQPYTPNE